MYVGPSPTISPSSLPTRILPFPQSISRNSILPSLPTRILPFQNSTQSIFRNSILSDPIDIRLEPGEYGISFISYQNNDIGFKINDINVYYSLDTLKSYLIDNTNTICPMTRQPIRKITKHRIIIKK